MVSGEITVVAPITATCDLDIQAIPEGYPNIGAHRSPATLTINVDNNFNPGLILDGLPTSIEIDTSNMGIPTNQAVSNRIL